MTPYYQDNWLTLYGGDCRAVLATLPDDSVDCVVTSPPYWGLRDYGIDGQLGLEATPEQYVANMVAVFREVRRVLKPSGTCWLNLGDSYVAGGGDRKNGSQGLTSQVGHTAPEANPDKRGLKPKDLGLKPKDLVGIPWRVAFALQADGWFLRSDIIWAKPNPMPESVTDRPTKAHEYIFLLTKSARYFFDADAVAETTISHPAGNGFNRPERISGGLGMGNAEPWIPKSRESKKRGEFNGKTEAMPGRNAFRAITAIRNIRSVWTIASRPYSGAHFAVFPPELPERCIKAGSSERGVCAACGEPWERVVERTDEARADFKGSMFDGGKTGARDGGDRTQSGPRFVKRATGWRATCTHGAEPTPAVVLDPFAGSGTVGMVANRLSRRAILLDLNPEYLKQQLRRNAQTPLGLPA